MVNRDFPSELNIACTNESNAWCGSSSSRGSQISGDICRICHCESEIYNPLLTPCHCSGSLKYVHQACLQQWLTASETNFCELCKFPFVMHTKIKPLSEWRNLEMTGVERRRLCCAVLFHCAAALCVIWSLCVLIERATEEVKRGLIGWPFWTKLAVVIVGSTGGVVFMYVQCKQYFQLCQRWKAQNRLMLIQNIPQSIQSPSLPVLSSRLRGNNNVAASSTHGLNSYEYRHIGYESTSLTCHISKQDANHLIHNPRVDNLNSISNSQHSLHSSYDQEISSSKLRQSMSCIVSLSETQIAVNKPADVDILNKSFLNKERVRNNDDEFLSTQNFGIESLCPNGALFFENKGLFNSSSRSNECKYCSMLTSPNIANTSKESFSTDCSHCFKRRVVLLENHVFGDSSIPENLPIKSYHRMETFVSFLKNKPYQLVNIADFTFQNAKNGVPCEIPHLNCSDLNYNRYNYIASVRKSRISLNVDFEPDNLVHGKVDRSRLYFKSLPNLYSSTENLMEIM